jgi:DNA-binding MarR family transcriptional regulator
MVRRHIISIEINFSELFSFMINSPETTQPPEMTQQYDLRILRALRRITRAIALHSRHLAACSNITAPQLICLRAVIDHGPLTATAISREIHVSASTVVGILDRLEDKGLVRRERGREDRRIVFVSATEAGAALALETPSPLQTQLAAALNALPELEQATITLSLERVVNLMESGGAAPEVSGEPASPLLDVPLEGALPESGLAV